MMRRLWNIVAVFAIANLLGLAGFVAWLGVSDRLDIERARQIRAMLSETISEQRQREEEELAEQAQDAQDGDEAGLALSSSELVSMRLEGIEVDRERRARLKAEAEALRQALARQEALLAQERARLEEERKAFEEQIARIRATDGDRQFKKAVKVLDGMKPKEATAIIKAIMTGADPLGGAEEQQAGAGEGSDEAQGVRQRGVDLAVSYINAMQERTRLKLLAELARREPELAADLLDRLRTRGLPAPDTAGGS